MARPKIAVVSGPTATIQNSAPLVTSNKARTKYGLPLRSHPDGSPMRFDALRPQRLAAPVTLYIEQFSAHPLERDAARLYAPPDGYLDGVRRDFEVARIYSYSRALGEMARRLNAVKGRKHVTIAPATNGSVGIVLGGRY